MKLYSFQEFLFETNKYDFSHFTEEHKIKAKQIFQEVFDKYLRKVGNSYPNIYHCTNIEHYESIKNNGLTKERNYFMEYDNNLYSYGFSENDEELPGIACGVNYKDVIDRLYPDPEWLIDIVKKTGNPSSFEQRNIDDRIIYCLWITDILKLDINKDLIISDEQINFMASKNMFCWLYVKGKIPPNQITINIHNNLK